MIGVPVVQSKLMMKSIARISIATLASAVLPAVIFMLYSIFLDKSFLGWSVIIFPFVLLVTLSHSIFLGLPSFLLLKALDKLKVGHFALMGFGVGGLPSTLWAIFLGNNPFQDGWLDFVKSVSLLSMLGVIGALAFWCGIRVTH
jgi:hypothetical protein